MRELFWDAQTRTRREMYLLALALALFYLLFFTGIGWLTFLLMELDGENRVERNTVIGIAICVGVALVLTHLYVAIKIAAPRLLREMNGRLPDYRDRYHKRLINIVDEMSLAAGLKPPLVSIVPSFGLNALTIAYLGHRELLVTEGAVSTLKRDELQALTGAALCHLFSGDAAVNTMMVSIVGVFQTITGLLSMDKMFGVDSESGRSRRGEAFRETQLKGGAALFIYIFLVWLAGSVSFVFASWISMVLSRSRKELGDQLAVQFTRDPESLARVLIKVESAHSARLWVPHSLLVPLCVVPPGRALFRDGGILGNILRVHPPLEERVKQLTGRSVEEFKRTFLSTSPARARKFENRYLVHREGKWTGPFRLEEIVILDWIDEDTWVCREGTEEVVRASDIGSFRAKRESSRTHEPLPYKCPRCHGNLIPDFYEGARVSRCSSCAGTLAGRYELQKILIREEVEISGRTLEEFEKFYSHRIPQLIRNHAVKMEPVYSCPRCGKTRMNKRLFSMARPIVIDECHSCHLIWLDRGELELLQSAGQK